MHADIINNRDEGLRRILATKVEVDCVAGLDPLVDHLARDANPLAGLGIVNPEFYVTRWSSVCSS